ncbi:uncharacterized protein TRAVEDRAFT_41259 [Trametes versicolor FP-101664 SS1]|uniref:uncharacterized protein n=1 Tax=Trametes versicolor (strain FP-101664) TaxID=717944 RepID=UPI0004621F35|nr:uncharacterized protein TRAVEDRAFT_41259 [Trametes versicolor FP-101664 SS1]EIW63831.1 hypothetical protein TRAVEDRAFT_41259 [Trametes versicolor FP-101664 SS1]
MKTQPARKSARGQQPYGDLKGTRTLANLRNKATPPTPPEIPPSSSKPGLGMGAVLFRNLCMEKIRKDYPGVKPRNDYDISSLSEKRFKGSPAEIYAQLDEDLALDVGDVGYEFIMEAATAMLDRYVEPTGLKPGQSAFLYDDDNFIFIRPVPDSKYSVRLFPGSISAAEYCLDFVDTATGKSVNSPFEFELWGIPNPDTPWLSFPICGQLRSIEYAHGIKQKDILPGAEKFILRDGQTCLLVRPGKRSLRFTVPVRKMETPDVVDEVDVLDLPQFVGPCA